MFGQAVTKCENVRNFCTSEVARPLFFRCILNRLIDWLMAVIFAKCTYHLLRKWTDLEAQICDWFSQGGGPTRPFTILEPQNPSIGKFYLVEECRAPTNPFTILELQNPSRDVPELHKIRGSPDLEALKL